MSGNVDGSEIRWTFDSAAHIVATQSRAGLTGGQSPHDEAHDSRTSGHDRRDATVSGSASMLTALSPISRSVRSFRSCSLALVIVLFALAVLALRASPRAWANRSLAGGALAAAVWVLGVCGLQTGTDLQLWLAVAFSGASFIPAALLQLVRHYPVTTPSPSPAVLVASYVLATGFACLLGRHLASSSPGPASSRACSCATPGRSTRCSVAYFLLAWAARHRRASRESGAWPPRGNARSSAISGAA